MKKAVLYVLISVLGISIVTNGGEDDKLDHAHAAVEIEGDPILKRLPMNCQVPRRIIFDSKGNMFVADYMAGVILKMESNGKISEFADSLSEPSGLAIDKKGNLYVSNHASSMPGQGSVVRFSPDGKRSVVAVGLTGPKGMAFDNDGNLFVANFDDNTITKTTPKGQTETFVEKISTPAGLVFDKEGNLFAVNSMPGTVSKISRNGQISIIARDLQIPSDITITPDKEILVTNYRSNKLTTVAADGSVGTFATVPVGCIAIAYDRKGGLFMLNWDQRAIYKIITSFAITCPHCPKKIPVQIVHKPKKSESVTDREFGI